MTDPTPPSPTPSTEWFFSDGTTSTGPLPIAVIQQHIRAGVIRSDTLMWRPGLEAWTPASMFHEFAGQGHDAPRLSPPISPGLLAPPPGSTPAIDTKVVDRMLLPVGRSGYAIAAGYLGLFSVLLVPAPLALLFGILAVRHIRRTPNVHGMGRAVFGIVMGTLGSLACVFMLIGILTSK